MTPRIAAAHGSINASSVERGASLAAFPRRAWERSMRTAPDQVGCQAASLSRLILIWLLIFLPHRGDPRSRTGARACRALARHRTPGARALGYLGPGGVPLFQVTRCKSETLGGRYRRNGYVHLKDNHRLSGQDPLCARSGRQLQCRLKSNVTGAALGALPLSLIHI